MMRVSRLTLVLASTTLVLGACRKKPVVAPQAETAPVVQPQPTRPTNTTPAPAARDTMEDYRTRLAATRARLLETIYFEYDADELREDAKANLDAKITVLNANPAVKIRIAGHCDERGGGQQKRADHFTSPSPDCPSSKSLTGRRLGSIASNSSAPSIHTFSGRV